MYNVDYVNTFILVADDTSASHGAEPLPANPTNRFQRGSPR